MKPMVIIELAGGLGNQMFQYAFFLKMQHLGHPCKLYFDPSQYIHNGPELHHVFGVPMPFAKSEELDELLDKQNNILAKIRRKVRGRRAANFWEHDKGYAFKPNILRQQKPVYLQGCWLSPKYFNDIADQVRNSFRFPDITDKGNMQVMENIRTSHCSVSVHARFGDYLSSATHLNLDYRQYLEKAITHLPDTENLDFFIFSDDPGKAKNGIAHLENSNHKFHFVISNEKQDSWKDMALMSNCMHHIIANSTFSWWAAWLNPNPNKIVISPKDWFTNDFLNDNDIVPDEWIKI